MSVVPDGTTCLLHAKGVLEWFKGEERELDGFCVRRMRSRANLVCSFFLQGALSF